MNTKIKALLSATVAVALFAPSMASAQMNTGNPPPKEKSEYRGPNRAMLTSGAIVFGVPYVTSVLVAATTPSDATNRLYIPFAGPWMTLGQRTCTPNDPCEAETLTGIMLVGDGLLQGIGGLGMIASFFVPESQTPTPSVHVGSAKVTVAPAKMGRGGYGISAVAEF